jgi:AraC-like DNA-binding protein
MDQQLRRLRELAERHADGRATETAIPRVSINVALEPTSIRPGLYPPMLCMVLQGAKEVMIGGQRLRYDPAKYFIAGLDLPASGRIVEAGPTRPYVSVSLHLNRESLTALVPDVPLHTRAKAEGAGFAVSPVTPQMLGSWLRLLDLLDAPQDIPVLAPMIEREILYRVLQGPQTEVLRGIVRADGRHAQIRLAIAWIRAHYNEPLRVGELAELAGMSAASFHRHFKAATAVSPLQYQKSIRLQEARKLLIGDLDASSAAYAVGYESPSQFSREYARLFGASPARDAVCLRRSCALEAPLAEPSINGQRRPPAGASQSTRPANAKAV